MRRSSSATSANANPLGLEWDPLPPSNKASPPTNSTRKLSNPAPPPPRVDSSPPKAAENRNRTRNRRESKPRLSIAPPSPTKEPRHVPGSAPKKQSAPPSPSKAERESKRDKEAKARRSEVDEGWTTVGGDRGRKK
jgi:hypothetical protein